MIIWCLESLRSRTGIPSAALQSSPLPASESAPESGSPQSPLRQSAPKCPCHLTTPQTAIYPRKFWGTPLIRHGPWSPLIRHGPRSPLIRHERPALSWPSEFPAPLWVMEWGLPWRPSVRYPWRLPECPPHWMLYSARCAYREGCDLSHVCFSLVPVFPFLVMFPVPRLDHSVPSVFG